MPLSDLLDTLTSSARREALDAMDGLLRSHAESADLPATVVTIADRMLALDLPLERLSVLAEAVAADADAIECTWNRDDGRMRQVATHRTGDVSSGKGCLLDAPSALDRWTDLRSNELSVDRSTIVTNLRRCGITQILCVPLPLARGGAGWLLLMTADPAGFTPADRAMLETLVPSIGVLLATRIDRLTDSRLLRTYVGDGAHRAILSGIAKRGEAIPIRSAIFFADMRDSLGHTAGMDSFSQVDLLNDFFDCLVPPIEARGGEVLKFTGDGLLAVFPEQGDDKTVASDALDAAREVVENLAAMNDSRPRHRPIELGIGLHYGEAAYGNIGSGLRLDFTVVGRNIGLASRIGDLNKVLSEPHLMSSCFAEQLRGGGEPVGTFKVAGVPTPVAVFRPIREAAAA
ncbi:MAG: adenylate/guanylate cyclase domain-containing protein [Janthinobacterium lividum]